MKWTCSLCVALSLHDPLTHTSASKKHMADTLECGSFQWDLDKDSAAFLVSRGTKAYIDLLIMVDSNTVPQKARSIISG